jgi:hypothetical protein
MARVCTEITEWIRETISKPVEQWEEDRKKECKKRHWYDPRSWFCWFTVFLVKVIRWVVITVVRAVVSLVCRIIAVVLGLILDLLQFLGLLIKALFTWDKCTLQEALAELGNGIIDVFTALGEIVFGPFGEALNEGALRDYVKDQIESKFAGQPDLIDELKKAFHVDAGVFGYRMTCKVFRLYVDSQTMTSRYADVPNLVGLHRERLINLHELAGFHAGKATCAIFDGDGWYRPRPETATFPFASGGGLGDPNPPPLKREQLDAYVNSGGGKGPHFLIYAMSRGNLGKRLDAAAEKGRQLGLILDIVEERPIEVTEPGHMYFTEGVQNSFLKEKLARIDEDVDATGARLQLCSPVAVGVFRFADRKARGFTENLTGTTACRRFNLPDSDVSGCTFIDDIPDEIRKYVLIHELGHYFGLCHVDGFYHIMVSGKAGQGDLFTWDTIPAIFFHGGPYFTPGEARQVWDYILDHFPVDCLRGTTKPPEGPFL